MKKVLTVIFFFVFQLTGGGAFADRVTTDCEGMKAFSGDHFLRTEPGKNNDLPLHASKDLLQFRSGTHIVGVHF